VLQVAGATKKAAPKKPAAPKKATTPAVLTGTVPEWANSTAIAQLLGKTTRRIQQLTQDGILETEVPPGGGARKYRTCETIQRYIAHVEQKAQEVGEGGRLAELNLKKLEAEVALKESQGSLHRLKTAIAEGKYIPAEQATEELAEFMAAFQKFAMTIPARMAGAMAGYADAITIRNAQKAIRKELETMLTAYVDAMQAEDPPEGAP
jgi:phage terminase Nu1 subunit (DNA packaging protein)